VDSITPLVKTRSNFVSPIAIQKVGEASEKLVWIAERASGERSQADHRIARHAYVSDPNRKEAVARALSRPE
jgi:hypothetical protein